MRQYKLIEHPAQVNCVAHGHGDGNVLEKQKKPNLNTTDFKLGHQSENLSWNSVNIFSNFSFIKDHVLRIG